MSEVEDKIEWVPMKGQMNETECRTLGINPLPGVSYFAMWFFGQPLIVEYFRGDLMSAHVSVQNRALTAIGVQGLA